MVQIEARPSVLIVDDEPRILSSMAALLEDEYSVLSSTSAENALNMLEQEQVLEPTRMPHCPMKNTHASMEAGQVGDDTR